MLHVYSCIFLNIEWVHTWLYTFIHIQAVNWILLNPIKPFKPIFWPSNLLNLFNCQKTYLIQPYEGLMDGLSDLLGIKKFSRSVAVGSCCLKHLILTISWWNPFFPPYKGLMDGLSDLLGIKKFSHSVAVGSCCLKHLILTISWWNPFFTLFTAL